MGRESTRMAWTALDGRLDLMAVFGRRLPRARIAIHGDPAWASDGSAHHVAIVQTRWRTRHYLDGKRVRRWHPYLRALRRNAYVRKMLGL